MFVAVARSLRERGYDNSENSEMFLATVRIAAIMSLPIVRRNIAVAGSSRVWERREVSW